MDVGSIQNPSNLGASLGVVRLPAAEVARKPAATEETLTSGEAASPQATEQAQGPITREQVEAAVATIQEFVQSVRRSINFSLDDGTGQVVVKVTDAGSGDVIRQIPSEEALQLAENLAEVRSLLFKAEA